MIRSKSKTVEIELNDKVFIIDVTTYDEEDYYSDPYDPGTPGAQWVEVDDVKCFDEEGNDVDCTDKEYEQAANLAEAKAPEF